MLFNFFSLSLFFSFKRIKTNLNKNSERSHAFDTQMPHLYFSNTSLNVRERVFLRLLKDSTVTVPNIQIINRRAAAQMQQRWLLHASQQSASALKISAARETGFFSLPSSDGLCTPFWDCQRVLIISDCSLRLGMWEHMPIRNELSHGCNPVPALKQ